MRSLRFEIVFRKFSTTACAAVVGVALLQPRPARYVPQVEDRKMRLRRRFMTLGWRLTHYFGQIASFWCRTSDERSLWRLLAYVAISAKQAKSHRHEESLKAGSKCRNAVCAGIGDGVIPTARPCSLFISDREPLNSDSASRTTLE
jgi:hypothetical protein